MLVHVCMHDFTCIHILLIWFYEYPVCRPFLLTETGQTLLFSFFFVRSPAAFRVGKDFLPQFKKGGRELKNNIPFSFHLFMYMYVYTVCTHLHADRHLFKGITIRINFHFIPYCFNLSLMVVPDGSWRKAIFPTVNNIDYITLNVIDILEDLGQWNICPFERIFHRIHKEYYHQWLIADSVNDCVFFISTMTQEVRW